MKKLLFVLLLAVLTLGLVACSELTQGLKDDFQNAISDYEGQSEIEEAEDAADQLSEDTTYYNGHLGISYTVPSGWWIYYHNTENFTGSAAQSANYIDLDIYEDNEFSYMELINVSNLQYSSRDNHLGFNLNAEKTFNVDYLSYFEEYMLEDVAGYDPYILEEKNEVEINGQTYNRLLFKVMQEGREYYEVCYLCQVRDDYFLIFSANYWPENANAPQAIEDNIANCLNFE